MKAFVATAKGLLIYSLPEKGTPRLLSSHFLGFNTTFTYVDPRTRRWWAGVSHRHWGQKLHYSDDAGATWHERAMPSFGEATMPDGSGARMRQIWCMTHGGTDLPGVLWVGTDPGGLFRSDDDGESFSLVESLWNHPSRKSGNQWFGAGSDHPFIHTILVDPRDSNHVYVAVSCAGIFETLDGGATWKSCNNGLLATYLPDAAADVGHDPHAVKMVAGHPEVLWQQNHCGIFYSRNGGADWLHASEYGIVPDYGFSLVAGDRPECAWVIPVLSDEQRIAPQLGLKVFKTEDFGQNWTSDSKGLPEDHVFDIVLRQAFDKHNQHMLFGTTNGNLYYRREGDAWQCISTHLTKVSLVSITD